MPSYKESHYKLLNDVEKDHFWFGHRADVIVWFLRKHFPEARKLLEVGCGTGAVLAHIKRSHDSIDAYGMDCFHSALRLTRDRRMKVFLVQGDIMSLPFRPEFDVVCAFDVLEHMENDLGALKQMHGALREDGGIILTVPQHRFLWSGVDRFACHVRRYSWRDLRNVLNEAGFSGLKGTSLFTFLFPMLALSRFYKGRRTLKEPELAIHPITNAFLKKICAMENSYLRKGIEFPFGGTRLAIAWKKGR